MKIFNVFLTKIKWISIISTLIICAILVAIEIYYFQDYGLTVFILIPFLLGFLPPFFVGIKNEISRDENYDLSSIAFGITFLCFFIVIFFGSFEMLIAYLFPLVVILAPISFLGSYLGYKIQTKHCNFKNCLRQISTRFLS